MKKIIFYSCTLWIATIGAIFYWHYIDEMNAQETLAFDTARSFFEQVVLTREWNAEHGGVYVPVTDKTKPNPYLDDSRRDIRINEELTLTKINPAFMTRQISEMAARKSGIKFHITSLDPIRPGNSATPLEVEALTAFENGQSEFGRYVNDGISNGFFFMAPLIAQQACLKCHDEYQEGDFRGGISVMLPFVTQQTATVITWGYSGIGLVGIIGIIVFGMKLTEAYETIKHQAIFDGLTEIPNRRSFENHVAREFGRCRHGAIPLSILMCDIDHFKLFNDTYGHSKGDDCLKRVAQVIQETLHREGDFCARYGGEEFVVILPNTLEEGGLRIAEAIRANIEALEIPHVKSQPAGVVTLSIGLATTDSESYAESAEKLIHDADVALYEAKKNGRNRIYVEGHG